MRYIDLSVPMEPSPSEPLGVTVRHESHVESAERMAAFFGCAPADFPAGLGWANDRVELHAHAGTHVDAPWHYFPTSQGTAAPTIDQLPLAWFHSDGVVLDVRDQPRGALVTVDALKRCLDRLEYALKPFDIVMLHTGTDKLWGTPEYFHAGCGLGRDGVIWLCDQGVKVIGTDAWGLDRPFWAIREEFERNGDPSIIWAAHRAGIEREYCQIEKLANLHALPRPFGFKVACFPVKLTGGSGGWSRVVALVDD